MNATAFRGRGHSLEFQAKKVLPVKVNGCFGVAHETDDRNREETQVTALGRQPADKINPESGRTEFQHAAG